MRQKSMLKFFALVAVLIAAVYYFLAVNPITNHLRYGLDLKGGVTATYQAEPAPGEPVNKETMARAMSILGFRVNALGVSEPVIEQVGSNRITVDLPGVKNPEQALQFLGQTAVLQIKSPAGQVLLSGGDLKNAVAGIVNGQYVVNLTFNAQGTKIFAAATKKYLGKPLPIYLNGKLVEAPIVQNVIPDGQAQMSGNFTSLQQAQKVALLLQSGALPVNLKVLDVRTVSATLGHASVVASKVASIIAIALIGFVMIVWYRLAGFVADMALLIYLLLVVGALWAIHAVITVPGIAGLILSVGMAVDANVIIFSRIREEMINGKTPRASVAAGFRHAIRAILDSHVTTFVSSLILFFLGTGEVKGFALTLMIGTAVSLLTAVSVTGVVIRWVADAGWAKVRSIFVG
ncbi:protein translocase subunit SecD [Sulfobacillus thermosulfidooxidans]|uniref:protein translocase subunit SecD n=1 Tax=Sulfobacillus thermosulfidooxidans TaxID=28034 RepID=UPI00041459F8|nr:protein translocase subunit SecD [Sulfobacillus thermosulfidooxidans]